MHRMHQMRIERDSTLPEFNAMFGIDEAVVEGKPCEHCADAQYDERDEHDPWAFMRVIAAGPASGSMVSRRVGMIL